MSLSVCLSQISKNYVKSCSCFSNAFLSLNSHWLLGREALCGSPISPQPICRNISATWTPLQNPVSSSRFSTAIQPVGRSPVPALTPCYYLRTLVFQASFPSSQVYIRFWLVWKLVERLVSGLSVCIGFLGLHNKTPRPGGRTRQTWIFSQFWRLQAQDQGVSRFGFSPVLSPRLAGGCLLPVSSRGPSSVRAHPWCVSVCLNLLFL